MPWYVYIINYIYMHTSACVQSVNAKVRILPKAIGFVVFPLALVNLGPLPWLWRLGLPLGCPHWVLWMLCSPWWSTVRASVFLWLEGSGTLGTHLRSFIRHNKCPTSVFKERKINTGHGTHECTSIPSSIPSFHEAQRYTFCSNRSVVNSRVVAVEPSNIAVSMLKAANAIGHVMAPVALIAGTIRPHLWCGYRLPGWTTGQPVGYRGGLQVNHPPVELLTSGHGNLYYEWLWR